MKAVFFHLSVLTLLFQLGSCVDTRYVLQNLRDNQRGALSNNLNDCDSTTGVGCDALCMIYLPYYTGSPFRSGCPDADGNCWCCDGLSNGDGTVRLCPYPEDVDCAGNCHQYQMNEVSSCPSYGGSVYSSGPSY